jgi:hypothetical protein
LWLISILKTHKYFIQNEGQSFCQSVPGRKSVRTNNLGFGRIFRPMHNIGSLLLTICNEFCKCALIFRKNPIEKVSYLSFVCTGIPPHVSYKDKVERRWKRGNRWWTYQSKEIILTCPAVSQSCKWTGVWSTFTSTGKPQKIHASNTILWLSSFFFF